MKHTKSIVKRLFLVLTCAALIVWSVMPSYTHAPTVLETIQEHLEMVEEHGHSHGFEADILWAMHGHSHDLADHDHSQAFLMPNPQTGPSLAYGEPWLRIASTRGPSRQFRIDRPPRV